MSKKKLFCGKGKRCPPKTNFFSPSDENSTKVKESDARSPMGKLIVQNKKIILKQIILDQLQHYSQTGERLYTSIEEVQARSGFSHVSVMRHAKIMLEQIFIDPETAILIYDMIFGKITTSYQKTKTKCFDNGLMLITTPTQWFDKLKNREEVCPSHLYVEVQCTKSEGHKNSVQISQISGCYDCMIDNFAKEPLNFQDILNLASEHNIQAMSFFDDSQKLTKGEFNELVKAYKTQHQNPDNYKTGKLSFLNLKWKCLECDYVFEKAYYNIQISKIKHYCPKCVSSIDQQITLEKTEEAFQDYIVQRFESDVQLTKFLPNRILLIDEYQVLRDPRSHIDVYGVISVAGNEFKIAIEHQGPQHYSLKAYINLVRGQDIKRGIYKTDAEYKIMFDAQIERDQAKVELFGDLNKNGYYLIVVPYNVPPGERKSFILQEFIEQTRVNPGQTSIADYL